jgi:phthalate 4,5-cis-dihydrodiol dehydrogenase
MGNMTAVQHGNTNTQGQPERVLNFGIAGLGIGSGMVLPGLMRMPIARVVAAADIRADAQEMFRDRYNGRAYDSVEKLCEDPEVDVIWVATPNDLHCEHVVMAARNGKHIVCEKPMAVSVEEARRMVDAADENGVTLVLGHPTDLGPAIAKMTAVARSGELGRVIQMGHWMYSDWLLKPRMPEEYDINRGGGVIYRHGPHIVNTIRAIGGGMVRSVRANWGAWMPERPAPGNYSAFIEFEDGTPATISYNGYGYFNTQELAWGIGDRMYSMDDAIRVRRGLRSGELDVAAAKEKQREETRTEAPATAPTTRRPTGLSFGIHLVSCERGTLRHSQHGLLVYDDNGQRELEVEASETGLPEVKELYDAVTQGIAPKNDGRWGLATLEVLIAIMQSGRERREIMLSHQCPVRE